MLRPIVSVVQSYSTCIQQKVAATSLYVIAWCIVTAYDVGQKEVIRAANR